jgi:PHD/YefM family antitoxin component YafN of YafNO toxin-antitoxin module
MRVISTSEFRDNMKSYLDLASSEQILIHRGKDETFELVKQQRIMEPNDDFYRSISGEEFRKRAHEMIDRIYQLPR